mgnify:FL=1
MFVISFFIILNFSLILFNKNIANILKLYDHPNKDRKLHKEKTPITGGFIIIINLIFYYFLREKLNFDINLFANLNNFYIFSLTCLFLYLLGVYDDKFEITANKKFFILILILIPTIFLDQEISLQNIRLSFFKTEYSIGSFSYIWTLICFLLLLNAINMFDGINIQVGFYALVISIIFIASDYNKFFFIILLISLISFLFLNVKSNSFLGDGGSYLLSFIIGYFFIKIYNSTIITNADQIVLIMLIPGLDLMRLFIFRILSKRHPFSPDRNHLHHLLLKKFSYYQVISIIQFMIFLPVIINLLFGYTLGILILSIIFYILVVYKLS